MLNKEQQLDRLFRWASSVKLEGSDGYDSISYASRTQFFERWEVAQAEVVGVDESKISEDLYWKYRGCWIDGVALAANPDPYIRFDLEDRRITALSPPLSYKEMKKLRDEHFDKNDHIFEARI